MPRYETTALKVCVDCLMIAANGETSGEPDRPPLGMIPLGSTVSPGGEHTCTDPLTVECECDSLGFFVAHECDGCGSTLGGDRYAATMLTPA